MKPALLVAVGLVFGAIIAVAIIAAPILPDTGSEQAENVDYVYWYLIAVCGLIFGVVTVVLVYAAVRFRGKPGDLSDGPPIHGITWLEAVWTLIPVAIVVSIVVFSWVVLEENDDSEAADRLNVHVTGRQFSWSYDYLDQDIGIKASNELVLPEHKAVRFELTSDDVIHSWWIPDWRLQMNTTPGQTNVLSVTTKGPGTHEVVCAFLCGIGHAGMNSEVSNTIRRIRVVSEQDFEQWVADQQAKQQEAASQPGAEGLAVFKQNPCGGCHTLAAAGSTGNIGPPLEKDSLQKHADEAGQPLEDYVRQSILDPGAFVASGVKPGMPDNFDGLEGDQLDQLVTLLAGGGQQ